jgi:hypothetical protein
MVRAILEGWKCQTRRPIKPIPEGYIYSGRIDLKGQLAARFYLPGSPLENGNGVIDIKSPFGSVGDILWVRETARLIDCVGFMCKFRYEADGTETRWIACPERLKPLEFGKCVPNGCFLELARIILKNDLIKVEHLQDISINDILDEGYPGEDREMIRAGFGNEDNAIEWFADLWDSIYKSQGLGWEVNPYVFAAKVHRAEV